MPDPNLLRSLLFHFCRPRHNENVIAVGVRNDRRGPAHYGTLGMALRYS